MKAVLAAAIVAVLISATTATAAFVVTNANIKNGTIQLPDLSPAAKRALRGKCGFTGAPGPSWMVNAYNWDTATRR